MTSVSCWNCNREMIYVGHAGYYDFYRCPVCKAEHAKYEPIAAGDSDSNAIRPDTPQAFPGSDIRGTQGWGNGEIET